MHPAIARLSSLCALLCISETLSAAPESSDPAARTNVTRQIQAERKYLNFPVKNGAPKRWVTVAAGDLRREFEIELADATPDFWVFLELTPFRGRSTTLTVDKLPAESKALDAI